MAAAIASTSNGTGLPPLDDLLRSNLKRTLSLFAANEGLEQEDAGA